MDINKQFKLKFNELDQICRKLYPGKTDKFDALREFAYSLDQKSKSTLLNIIKIRNVNTHDDTDLFHFNRDAITFLQGLIDGANRKYYNGARTKIDSKIENLRTKNLKQMGSRINEVLKKYSFLNVSSLNSIKTELNNYIELERKANGLENVKKCYFDFLNAVGMIESRNDVRNARSEQKNLRQQQRNQNIQKAKNRAINEIENYYLEAMNNTSVFSIGKRKRIKEIRESARQAILRCNNYDDIDDVLLDYEDLFDDLNDN